MTSIFFAIALLHVFSAIYFAAIRWFHVCAPYKDNADKYYPARKCLSLMCLLVMVELPYVFHPSSDVCFLTACVVLACGYPLAAILVSYSYFKSRQRYSSLIWMAVPIVLGEIFFSFLAVLAPNFCDRNYAYIVVILSTVSFLLYVLLAVFCYVLYRQIRKACLDTYSEESTIPTRMGYTALFSMMTIFVLTSLPLVTQSRISLAIVQVVLIVWHVVFLIYILDSHINPKEEELFGEDVVLGQESADSRVEDQQTNVGMNTCPEESLAGREMLLLKEIEEFMQTKRPYLNAHFTAVELAAELGTNRTYLTNAIKLRYESFYHLVNSYRLKYADEYQLQHPDVKKENLAIVSGFGSYRSYLRALKSIG